MEAFAVRVVAVAVLEGRAVSLEQTEELIVARRVRASPLHPGQPELIRSRPGWQKGLAGPVQLEWRDARQRRLP